MTINPSLDQVREEYLRRLTSGRGHLLQAVEEFVASRMGKMLRPRMLIEAANTLPHPLITPRQVLLLAVCMEMVHNASLLHDDVIDRASSRRGMPSVNAQWNNAVAVLVGDYLLAQIMLLLDEVDLPDAARRVNSTVMTMVESELLQQELLSGRTLTEQDYLAIIDGKTACLFSTAASLGNPAYEAYGLAYGRLFQLYDDLRDCEASPWTQSLIDREQARLEQLRQQGIWLPDLPLPSLQMQ